MIQHDVGRLNVTSHQGQQVQINVTQHMSLADDTPRVERLKNRTTRASELDLRHSVAALGAP
jgi:hypothetical protein